MSRSWYYSHLGQQSGPISDEQLQALATSGQLAPTDQVWSEGMPRWCQARLIPELSFPAMQTPPPIPGMLPQVSTPPSRSSAAPARSPLRENPFLIGVSLLFCFPVGLFLIWKHSTWAATTKWLWTGAFAGLLILGGIHEHMQAKDIAKTLAEATILWDSGKKAEAVDRYRSLSLDGRE